MASLQKSRIEKNDKKRERRKKSRKTGVNAKIITAANNNRNKKKVYRDRDINSVLGIDQIEKAYNYSGSSRNSGFDIFLSSNSERNGDLNKIASDLIGKSYREKYGDDKDEDPYIEKNNFIFKKKMKSSSSRSKTSINRKNKKDVKKQSKILSRVLPPVHRKKKYTKVRKDYISTRYTNVPVEWEAFQPPVLVRENKPKNNFNDPSVRDNDTNSRRMKGGDHNLADDMKKVLYGSRQRQKERDRKIKKVHNYAYELYENKNNNVDRSRDSSADKRKNDNGRIRNAKVINRIGKTGKQDVFDIGSGKQRRSRDTILSLNRLYRYDTQGMTNDSVPDYINKSRKINQGFSDRWNTSFRNKNSNNVSSVKINRRFSSDLKTDFSNKSDGELTWEQYQMRYPTKQFIRESLNKIKKVNLKKTRELKVDSISKKYANSPNLINLELAHEEFVNTMAVIAASRLYLSKMSIINIHDPSSINTNVNKSIDIIDGYSDLSGSSLSRKNRPLWKSSPSLFNKSTPILYEVKNLREHCIFLGWRSAILSIRKSLTFVSQCSDSRSIIEDEKRYFSGNFSANSSSSDIDIHSRAISYILYAYMIFENIIPNQMRSSAGSIERFSATTSASIVPELNIEIVRSFAKICTVLIHNIIENKASSPILQFANTRVGGNGGGIRKQLDLKWLNCVQKRERDYLLNESTSNDRYRGGIMKDLEIWLFSSDTENENISGSVGDINIGSKEDMDRFEFMRGDENYNRMIKTIIKEKEICVKGMDTMILSKFGNILKLGRAFTCMQCIDINCILDTHCWRSKHINVLSDINSLNYSKPFIKIQELTAKSKKNSFMREQLLKRNDANQNEIVVNPEDVMSRPSFCASEAQKMMQRYLDDTTIDTKIISDIYIEYMPSLALKNLIYGICIQNECLLGLSTICDLSSYDSSIPSENDDGGDEYNKNVRSLHKKIIGMNKGIYENDDIADDHDDSEMVQTAIETLSKIAPMVEELLIPQFGRRSIAIEMICWIMSYINNMAAIYPAFKQIKYASYHSSDIGKYGDDVSYVEKSRHDSGGDNSDNYDEGSMTDSSDSDYSSSSSYSDDDDDDDDYGNDKRKTSIGVSLSNMIGESVSNLVGGMISSATGNKRINSKLSFLKKQYDIRMTQNILHHGETCSCLRILLGFPEAMPTKYSREWYRIIYKGRKLPKPENILKPSDFDSKQKQLFNKFGLIDKESIVFDKDRQKMEDRRIENELIMNIRKNNKILQGIVKSESSSGRLNLNDLRGIDRLEYALDPYNKVINSEQINEITSTDVIKDKVSNSLSNAFNSLKNVFSASRPNENNENNSSDDIITWQSDHDKIKKSSSSRDTKINDQDHERYQRFSRLFEKEEEEENKNLVQNEFKRLSEKKLLLRDNSHLPQENNRIIPISERDVKSWEYLIGLNTIQVEEYFDIKELGDMVDSFFPEKDEILREYDKSRENEIPIFSVFAEKAKSMMGTGINKEYNEIIENISKETNNITFFLLKENGYFNEKNTK